MQGLMVWFRSVWPSLRVWCITIEPSFFGIQGYSLVSECDFCSVSSKLKFFVSSFTGASNARFDGMV